MKRILARLALLLALVGTLPLASSAPLFAQGVALAVPVVQFVDGNGAPYAGGQLFAYIAGTLTPQATFTDSTDATPNANPVILDANGRAVVYLGPFNYKFILKNALGSTVWTQDNVPALAPFNTTATNTASIAALQPGVLTSATTGFVTSQALPAGNGPLIIRFTNASSLGVLGFAPGLLWQRLTVLAVGTGQVSFSYNDAGAPVGSKIITFITAGGTFLSAGLGSAEFVYDGGRWVMVAHEQGAWITPPFAAVNFFGSASMTWTVTAGEVATCSFYQKGHMVSVVFQILLSTVGGTLAPTLEISNLAWGGNFASGTAVGPTALSLDAGVLAQSTVTASGGNLLIQKTAGGNWAASTLTNSQTFSFTFPVQ
jgi:hypothetical protein